MEKLKIETISFAQTFGALFIIDLAASVSQLGLNQILSGQALTGAFITGLISGAGRSALKAAWQKVMPIKLGGVRR